MGKREGFASSFGVLVAMAGSAVGLGNLWRFPYLVGTNGGAAFIIIYLACVLVLALPILYSEFIIGRRSQSNVFGAYKKLAPDSKWCNVGFIYVLCSITIISFYSVVGGWTIDYFVKAATFQFSSASADQLSGMFANTVTSTASPLVYMLVFLGITALIVLAGVKNGIEKYSKIMMPLLFILVIVIAIRSVTLENSYAGIEFLFKPDFSKITAQTFLDALGQAFFSLSVGSGSILTYASYVSRKENIVKLSAQTAISDTMFAIVAGVAIMPAVFAFGISPSEGPGLVFVTLPYIFNQLPFGSSLAVLFFFALFIAAITSSISMLEVIVAYLDEEFKLKRRTSIVLSLILIATLGVFCSLSQGIMSDVKILGNSIFDLFDKSSANIMLPLGGMIAVIFVGWRMKKAEYADEITSGGLVKFSRTTVGIFYFFIKYIAPVVIATIVIRSLF
ncbi:MAG: sodium-dependent transporter [Bacteroidales bacterium]|nr:sodium-dependent transporter [Bacteroidales bacterium]